MNPRRLPVAALAALILLGSPARAAEPATEGIGSKAVATRSQGDLRTLIPQAERLRTAGEGDAAQGPDAPSPWPRVASSLNREGLPYSALYAGAQALIVDPAGMASEAEALLDAAEQLGDEGLLADGLVQALHAEALPPPLASRAAVVAGKELLRRSELGAARALLQTVDRNTPAFPDAQMLLGIVIANQGRAADALPALLTAESAARNAGRDRDFQTATKLNVARAFYGAEQWAQAAAYFAQVPRNSDWWPDAQFERAWTHFRADDMENTLALLKNHDSPFFDGWYYPEADLLRAYALFTLCKFPSVTAEIEGFMQRYEPMKAELDRTLGRLTPAQALADVRALRAGQPTQLPAPVLRSFRADTRLTELFTALDALDSELSALRQRSGEPWAAQVAGWLEAHRAAKVESEGRRVLHRAERAATELAEMLQGIEITRIDMLAMETEMYERAAATGRYEQADTAQALRRVRRAQKNERVWPFQGEYWADELGYFRVQTRSDCPPSLSDGE